MSIPIQDYEVELVVKIRPVDKAFGGLNLSVVKAELPGDRIVEMLSKTLNSERMVGIIEATAGNQYK